MTKPNGPKTFRYDIEYPGELAAGLRGFTDTVTITVESGNPGGYASGPDSFQAFMRGVLVDWYDGAYVKYLSGDGDAEDTSQASREGVCVCGSTRIERDDHYTWEVRDDGREKQYVERCLDCGSWRFAYDWITFPDKAGTSYGRWHHKNLENSK